MKSTTMITIQPNGAIAETRHLGEPTLAELQAAVGGYIEPIAVEYRTRVCLGYVDEEGQLKGLAPNVACPGLVGPIVVLICD